MQRPLLVIFVLALAAITALAVAPGGTVPHSHEIDKGLHVLAFALLMGLAGAAIRSSGARVLVAVALLAFGVLLEIGQTFVPQHEASMTDIAGNVAGVVLALGGLKAFDQWRKTGRTADPAASGTNVLPHPHADIDRP